MTTVIKILTILIYLFANDSYGQTRDNLIVSYQKSSFQRDSIFYFPITTRIDSNKCIGLDSFLNKWYSKHLKAMNEPILCEGKFKKVIFRFTWLRSFDKPIMIRIEKQNDSIYLFYKMTNGTGGGNEPEEIVIDKKKKLTMNDWTKFIHLVDSCHFWSAMPCEKSLEGIDGSQWILEGATKEYYQVMDKWTPKKGAYYDCCNFLIQLTDLNINKKYKY